MQIKLGTEILCDGPDRSVDKNAGPGGDYSLDSPTEKQIARYLRATFGVPISRGNTVNVLNFSVKRQLASVAAAEKYTLSYPLTVTRSGTLEMTSGTYTVRMSNCVLDLKINYRGATVFIAYTITGGTLEVVS